MSFALAGICTNKFTAALISVGLNHSHVTGKSLCFPVCVCSWGFPTSFPLKGQIDATPDNITVTIIDVSVNVL